MYIYLSNFFDYFHVSISINFKYLIENFDSAADKLKKKEGMDQTTCSCRLRQVGIIHKNRNTCTNNCSIVYSITRRRKSKRG